MSTPTSAATTAAAAKITAFATRFRHFFQLEDDEDFRAGLATSEARERRRWQNIVAGVLNDVDNEAACFTAQLHGAFRPAGRMGLR